MSDTTTTYENKCSILADVWVEYKNDPELEDFVSYNDLGLPLAYAISTKLVTSSDLAQEFVEETFDMLLTTVFNVEDTGFESLADIFIVANKTNLQED